MKQSDQCTTAMSKQSDSSKVYPGFTYDYKDGEKDIVTTEAKTFEFVSADPKNCPLICKFIADDLTADDYSPAMPSIDPVMDFAEGFLKINTDGIYDGKTLKDGAEFGFRMACKTKQSLGYTAGTHSYKLKINSYCSQAVSI